MTSIENLQKTFEHFAHGQHSHTAFTELLDWTLLPFKQFSTAEEQQHAFEAFREHKKVDQLIPLIIQIGDLSEDFCDPLGEIYMRAISNGHNGQYFTPEPLCDLLSIVTTNEALADSEKVIDCACGSGRMLLSAAKGNRYARFYGADLDNTCCKMALVNMLLNSLTGEIAHMNSLSNDFYTGYKMQTTLVSGQHIPFYIEFTDAEQSSIWLHSLKGTASNSAFSTPFEPILSDRPINGVQISLF